MSRQRTPQGPPPPPVVQRLRIRYARRSRMRFTSTRDFARALERALRRAEVPMAFSAGFHPHPRISYAGGAPTGTASEAEYFEIALAQWRDPATVQAALDAALPQGLDILDVVPAGPGSLADRLQASEWRIELRGVCSDEERAGAQAALTTYLRCERVEVTRTFKNGPRTFDTRGAVVSAGLQEGPAEDCAILQMVVRHTTPSVRPDDILTALRAVSGFGPPEPALLTRLAQGPLCDASAQVGDPLAADREAVGPDAVPRPDREPDRGNS